MIHLHSDWKWSISASRVNASTICMTKSSDSTRKIQIFLVKFIGLKDFSKATIRRWHILFRSKDKGKETATTLVAERQHQMRKMYLQLQRLWRQTHVSENGKCFQSLHSHLELFIRAPWQLSYERARWQNIWHSLTVYHGQIYDRMVA